MNKSRIRPAALLMRVLLLSSLSLGCKKEHREEKEQPEIMVTKPLRKDTELVQEYVAQIRSIQHIELRALEGGYLEGVFIDEGQLVKEGERMFQIMPAMYQAEQQKAAAETEFAQLEYNNTKSLADRDVVSPNELALSKARLRKTQAELKLAKVHRRLTEIKAPLDGYMNRLMVRKGSLVEEGELLSTLSDNSAMWVYFNVTEAEYLDYKERVAEGGEKTKVKLRMANGSVFGETGIVETIEADFNNETGTIAFRATFQNPKALLRHGETGNVLMTTPLEDALLLPQKATFDVLDKKYVFTVDEKNVVHTKHIVVGEELPHLYVIEKGLTEKDTVVLEGIRSVRDWETVTPRPQDPAEVIANLIVKAE